MAAVVAAALTATTTGVMLYMKKQQEHSKSPRVEAQETQAYKTGPPFDTYVFPKHMSTSIAEVVELEVGTGARGLEDTKTYSDVLKSTEECEKLFKPSYRQKAVTLQREGNPVQGWDLMVLECNTPGEDRVAVDLVSQDDLGSLLNRPEAGNLDDTGDVTRRGEGGGMSFWEQWGILKRKVLLDEEELKSGTGERDLLLFSIFDGHGGTTISDLLAKVLHPTLLYALAHTSKECPTTKDIIQAGDLVSLYQDSEEVFELGQMFPKTGSLSILEKPALTSGLLEKT